jgi:ABC-type sugar transport system substrate-binding protein
MSEQKARPHSLREKPRRHRYTKCFGWGCKRAAKVTKKQDVAVLSDSLVGFLLAAGQRQRIFATFVVVTSLQQRDHQERLLGFRSSLETLAPSMRIAGVEEALDREEICYRFTKQLMEHDSSLKAVYHFGADMNGIVRAIQEAGRTDEIVVIGHELTDSSRQLLARGAITAILSQDASLFAERTLATFSDFLRGDLPAHRVYQLGPIEIFLRENLPPP